MAIRHLFKLRRGVKDDATGRDDWKTYEAQEGHRDPDDGELVLEYDNGIPRLKIGNGEDPFSALPYMSVDSFILPKQEFVTLSTEWHKETDDRYYQEVEVVNATITPKTKVDLQPTSEQLCVFHEKDLAFVAENKGGNVRVYCVGQVPQNSYDKIPVTVTEVVTDKEVIVGNTTATPNPRPDWNQTDSTKADYIKNKPEFVTVATSGSYNDLVDAPCYEGEMSIKTTIEMDRDSLVVELNSAMFIAYLVSENVYTRQQLIGSVATWTGEYYDYNSSVVIAEEHIAEETSDGMWIKVSEGFARTAYIYIAYTANYKPDGLQVTFPKKGVYFTYMVETDNPYVKSLSIDYEGTQTKTLDNKFLDLENNDVIKALLARIEALEEKINN